jgi:hypothetical protein
MFLLVAQLIMVLTVASSAQELSSGRVAASVSISPAELGDPASLRALRIGDRVLVRDVPTGDDTVALDLQRFSVTSPETRFVVGRSGRRSSSTRRTSRCFAAGSSVGQVRACFWPPHLVRSKATSSWRLETAGTSCRRARMAAR